MVKTFIYLRLDDFINTKAKFSTQDYLLYKC